MNSDVGKNYPFCDFETTSTSFVSYLEPGEEEWRTPVNSAFNLIKAFNSDPSIAQLKLV